MLLVLYPVHNNFEEPKIKLFRKVNISVLSHVTIYLEDDDHKPVDFSNETVSFTFQLIKILSITESKHDYTLKKTEDLLL